MPAPRLYWLAMGGTCRSLHTHPLLLASPALPPVLLQKVAKRNAPASCVPAVPLVLGGRLLLATHLQQPARLPSLPSAPPRCPYPSCG